MVKVVIGIAVAGVAAIILVAGAWALFIREDNELATSPQEIPDELVDPTAEPTAAAVDPTTAATDGQTLAFVINPELSEAAYFVDEELASVGLPSTAKGSTTDVTGTLYLTGDRTALAADQTSFTVDLTGLTSDESRRDQRVQEALDTGTFPATTFTIGTATGYDPSIADGVEQTIQLTGTLDLHGVQREVTWEVKAFREANVISALATVEILFSDYNITAPTFGGLVSIDDKATLQVQLIAEAA